MDPVDFVDFDSLEPCVFYTWEGAGWYSDPSCTPVRQGVRLSFDVLDSGTEQWEPCIMALEEDGLYHWREVDGPGHWWWCLAETESHLYLTGNYINPDGHQGSQIFVWPKS